MSFDRVRKAFGRGKSTVGALDDVTFDVRENRVTGLIGPDAAGKTTLMRLAAGLMKPDSGTITVLDIDVVANPLGVQTAVGYMPQRFGLYEDLSVQENLDLYADLQGVPATERPPRYQELMQMTGLGPFTKRLAGRLSGGMKQKLGLACTLVRSPQILLLDEPTVGVDPLSRRELWNIVYRLVREDRTTVLLSTAYLDEAERCDDIVMIHEGHVLGQGTPAHFKDQVRGRTYLASALGIRKRRLQEQLSRAQGVVDAIIQADNVRLVMADDSPATNQSLSAQVPGISTEPLAPRFEDSFVTFLRDRRQSDHGGGPAVSETEPPRRTDIDGPVIEVRELERRFGAFRAVKGISFEVFPGEVFGLLGANGAGKSTTFRMLCGLLPASSGQLRVAGVDLRRAAATARRRIGYMAQKFSLYGDLSVRQNLSFFSSAYGLSGRQRSERIEWATQQFDLEPVADSTCASLPLGYKQRLSMACALMHRPDILFLDEPTSGVDPLARREFWSRINALAERGVTVMVTTHFMEEAEYCDRLAIMATGSILAIGTPGEIRERARSPERPNPTMEDAFIALIEADQRERASS
jgi:ABC-2 type transport system ATP-binding protein